MNKPKNEPLSESSIYGAQLRYVSKRRIRKLRARFKVRGIDVPWREPAYRLGAFYSWLRPINGGNPDV